MYCLLLAALLVSCNEPAPGTPASAIARSVPESNRPVASVRAPISPRVTLGITVLLRDSAHLVRGRRVGLITNHTGRDETGRSTIDLLHKAPGVRLTALFAPEHGIRGTARGGALIASGRDSATGVRIHSLYGATRVPTPAMLQDVDVLLYDIQDVGARIYTYVWTMTLAAEAAKQSGKRFIVLDRPNPIRADIVEGGMIERRYRSFTGLHNVPLRYGLTPGELALFLQGTRQIAADVVVIPMQGYRRSMWWDETGLPWVNPSPNIRSIDAAALYPGTGFFEATNVSEGRGTDSPLTLAGASWLTDAPEIARVLNARNIPGVRFQSTTRRIAAGQKYGGRTIPVVRAVVTDRDALRSVDAGAHLMREIYRRHPSRFVWQTNGIELISGSRSLRDAVQRGGVEDVLRQWREESARFQQASAPYHLYSR